MHSVERTVFLLHDPLFLELFSARPSCDLILYYQNLLYFVLQEKCMYTKTSSAEYNPIQSLDFLAFFLALAGLSSFSVFRFFSFLLSTATSEAAAAAAAGAASRSTCCSTFITSPLNFLLVFSGPGVLNPYV